MFEILIFEYFDNSTLIIPYFSHSKFDIEISTRLAWDCDYLIIGSPKVDVLVALESHLKWWADCVKLFQKVSLEIFNGWKLNIMYRGDKVFLPV